MEILSGLLLLLLLIGVPLLIVLFGIFTGGVSIFVKIRDISQESKTRRYERSVYVQRQTELKTQAANPSTLFAQRMKLDANFKDAGTSSVSVEARYDEAGYRGVVVSASGKVLWKCRHQHRRQGIRRKHGRSTSSKDASIAAAYVCAQRELSGNQEEYKVQARSGTYIERLNRPAIENNVSYQTWGDLVQAFQSSCAYCGTRVAQLHRDHVVPLAIGGPHTMDNILPACPSCNLSKGTRRVREFIHSKPRSTLPRWIPTDI